MLAAGVLAVLLVNLCSFSDLQGLLVISCGVLSLLLPLLPAISRSRPIASSARDRVLRQAQGRVFELLGGFRSVSSVLNNVFEGPLVVYFYLKLPCAFAFLFVS